MSIPGNILITVQHPTTDADRSGRGRVVSCQRCKSLCEIVEHGPR